MSSKIKKNFKKNFKTTYIEKVYLLYILYPTCIENRSFVYKDMDQSKYKKYMRV